MIVKIIENSVKSLDLSLQMFSNFDDSFIRSDSKSVIAFFDDSILNVTNLPQTSYQKVLIHRKDIKELPGFDAYIKKPFLPKDIINFIKQKQDELKEIVPQYNDDMPPSSDLENPEILDIKDELFTLGDECENGPNEMDDIHDIELPIFELPDEFKDISIKEEKEEAQEEIEEIEKIKEELKKEIREETRQSNLSAEQEKLDLEMALLDTPKNIKPESELEIEKTIEPDPLEDIKIADEPAPATVSTPTPVSVSASASESILEPRDISRIKELLNATKIQPQRPQNIDNDFKVPDPMPMSSTSDLAKEEDLETKAQIIAKIDKEINDIDIDEEGILEALNRPLLNNSPRSLNARGSDFISFIKNTPEPELKRLLSGGKISIFINFEDYK